MPLRAPRPPQARAFVATVLLATSLFARAAAAQSDPRGEAVQTVSVRSVALRPARTPLILRVIGAGLLLIVVLGAIGRRRARAEAERAGE